MSNKPVIHCGTSTLTILGIVFVILKLCNVISRNWWLVCLPFIIEGGLTLIVLIVATILCFVGDR